MFGGIPEKEIDELNKYWKAFPGLRAALFSETSSAYAELSVEDIKNAITEHTDVKAFIDNFTTSFANFSRFLKNELLTNMLTLKISREETVLSEDIFKRLDSIPLIDKYIAYQYLDDEWDVIKVDLEIIQTEGYAATKKVDPNMVMKKKNGKDQEVQGWMDWTYYAI
jgi:type I restriction enzyme M protein